MNISIDEPCPENWEKMTVQENGRHCDVCCKTVVDFTGMPKEEVVRFLSERKKGSVCGRFRSEQVSVPPQLKVTKSVSDRVKRFFAALILVFGGGLFTGCFNDTDDEMIKADPRSGKLCQVNHSDAVKNIPSAKDTTVKKDTVVRILMGRVLPKPLPPPPPQFTQGAPRIEPQFFMEKDNDDIKEK